MFDYLIDNLLTIWVWGAMMEDEYWVVGVLHDISKFADEKGLGRLKKAMEFATDEYLNEIREQHLISVACSHRNEDKCSEERVVVQFQEHHRK